MSLFGSIQLARTALQADQIALQVAGQNIANANTPGYIREAVILRPAATVRQGDLLLGLGVQVDSVVQKIDKFLEERLRGAVSDQSSSQTLQDFYGQLEGVVGELGDNSLSNSLNTFFNSISEVLNQPESVSIRNMAVLQGESLAEQVVRIDNNVQKLRSDANDRIEKMADDINRLVKEVRDLNVRIAETEGGSISKSDAVGLRDQRLNALESLAQLVNIRCVEQQGGAINVYTGGDYLVIEGSARTVSVSETTDRGMTVSNIKLDATDAPLDPTSGELRGLLDARDKALGGFLDQLDGFASTLAMEFNRIYASGQGLKGYQELTSQSSVDDVDQPLNATGLKFPPENGSFQILVRSQKTGLTQTTDVNVDLNGLGHDTTLNDLVERLNKIDGITASTTLDRKLTLASTSADQEFSFANDTSGILTALGLNTFFTGSNGRDLAVNATVKADPATFAASGGGIGADTATATKLAQFLDLPLASQGGSSLSVLYDRLTSDTTQASTVAKAVADGANTYETTLRAQKNATSGVNLDEEAVTMLEFQKAFQASARYISTLAGLLDMLVQL